MGEGVISGIARLTKFFDSSHLPPTGLLRYGGAEETGGIRCKTPTRSSQVGDSLYR